jgi:subtilase family serine protease
MNPRRMRLIVALLAIGAAALLSSVPAAAQPAGPSARPTLPAAVPVCPGPAGPGTARCHAHVRTDVGHFGTTGPTGLSPARIQSAYAFPTSLSAGAGKTIAIVDAYDHPNIEKNLGVFSRQYNLPTCTTANGCFKKVNQTGGTRYPRTDSGWALEIALDVEWAHAIAPGARILLVEASSNSYTDLFAAVDYAKQHADYVSMSWGSGEFSWEDSFDAHFVQAGVSFFASSGDSGTPASYPSSSPRVISVGGTTLHFDAVTGAFTGETGWSGSGGGCSAYETGAVAQTGFGGYAQVGCGGMRATPDVALDADPASGVSVYDTVRYQGQSGWFTVGGTSASAPMWAARSAVAGATVDASYVYGTAIAYRDITSGNNGESCLTGYDLVTGRGSWIGATP